MGWLTKTLDKIAGNYESNDLSGLVAERQNNIDAFSTRSKQGSLLTQGDTGEDIIALLEKEISMGTGASGTATTGSEDVTVAREFTNGMDPVKYLAAYRGYIESRGAELNTAKAKSSTFLTGDI